jgi:DNA-binding NarL/FixJ family response regulator
MNQRAFVFDPLIAISCNENELPYSHRGSQEINGGALSRRECQILICLAQGKANKAIARLCDVSEATVKVHLKAILRKTQAQNRTEAAIWAIQRGFRDQSLGANGSNVANSSTATEPSALML